MAASQPYCQRRMLVLDNSAKLWIMSEVNIFKLSVFTTSVHVNYEKMVVVANKLWLKNDYSYTSKTVREGLWSRLVKRSSIH